MSEPKPCGFGLNGGECYSCELARRQREQESKK